MALSLKISRRLFAGIQERRVLAVPVQAVHVTAIVAPARIAGLAVAVDLMAAVAAVATVG